MARPRKGEGLLSERVVFRLRPEEVAGLTWAADQAGMHPADLTRTLLRAALAAGPAYFDDDIEQMQALIRGFNTKALIYPTLSLEWEAEVTAPEPALAYCRAYNRPDHDPLWAAAQDLGVPIGIHPVAEPPKRRVYQRLLS